MTYAGICHDSDHKILTLVFSHELPRFKLIAHKLSQTIKTVKILSHNQKWKFHQPPSAQAVKQQDATALNYTEEAVRGTLAKAVKLLSGAAIDAVMVYIECNYGFSSENIFPLYIRDNIQLKAIISEYLPSSPEMIMVATSSNADVVEQARACFSLQHPDDQVIDKNLGPLAMLDLYQKLIGRQRLLALESDKTKKVWRGKSSAVVDAAEPNSMSTRVSTKLYVIDVIDADEATQRFTPQAPAPLNTVHIDPYQALVEDGLVIRESFENSFACASGKKNQAPANMPRQGATIENALDQVLSDESKPKLPHHKPLAPSVPVAETVGCGCYFFRSKKRSSIAIDPDQGNEYQLPVPKLRLKRIKPALTVSG